MRLVPRSDPVRSDRRRSPRPLHRLASGTPARGFEAPVPGKDIIILDKTGVGAGPSGLACGVVRNNYFQPAMRRLMAHSVRVWESDPEAFHYHPVGYMQISPEVMHADVVSIYEQQTRDRIRVGSGRG